MHNCYIFGYVFEIESLNNQQPWYFLFTLKIPYKRWSNITSWHTVKPVNKGHPREWQHMIFKDMWSLFGGYFVKFYQGRVMKCGLYLQGGLYLEMSLNTVLTVDFCVALLYIFERKEFVFNSGISHVNVKTFKK